MKISMINSSNESKSLNVLDKNCLKSTDTFDYIDEDDSEKLFSIDEDNNQVAEVEACLAKEKAGLQIVRMRNKDKNLEVQKEALKEFTNYVWDVASMNHLVLAIHVLVDGSGVDCSVLDRLGFVGISGIGSELYTILNPKYMELVETLAPDLETSKKLTEYYDRHQKRKDRQLKQFEQRLQNMMMALSESENLNQQERDYVQSNIDYYTEAMNSLGAKEQGSKHL